MKAYDVELGKVHEGASAACLCFAAGFSFSRIYAAFEHWTAGERQVPSSTFLRSQSPSLGKLAVRGKRPPDPEPHNQTGCDIRLRRALMRRGYKVKLVDRLDAIQRRLVLIEKQMAANQCCPLPDLQALRDLKTEKERLRRELASYDGVLRTLRRGHIGTVQIKQGRRS